MSYLKLRNPAQQAVFTNLHGKMTGRMSQFKGKLNNQKLEFIEDANGDYVISATVASDPVWQDYWPQLSGLQEVSTYEPKPEEI